MRVVENKGITLLYISNGIHFKLSSLSAKRHQNWCLFCFLAITMIFRLSPDSIEVSHNTRFSIPH